MKNSDWNDVVKVKPPFRTDILVWDESMVSIRIMSAIPEGEEEEIINWYNADGFFDDSDPEITHWMNLPDRPTNRKK